MDRYSPYVALEVAKIMYPDERPLRLKLSIVGAAREGILWARAEKFTAYFILPAEMDERRRMAFGNPEYVDCPAFTYEAAILPDLWRPVALLTCRSPKYPADLPAKWQMGFSDEERTICGTLLSQYQDVEFDGERLFIALSRPDFLHLGECLISDFPRPARGRPNVKDWRAALTELVARTAAKEFFIPSETEDVFLKEAFTAELRECFGAVAPTNREPDSRELKKTGQSIAERLIESRKNRKKISRLRAP
jgi:hypothetical protein